MSEVIAEYLDQLARAIESDDFERVDSTLGQLSSAYDGREPDESVRLQKTRRAQRSVDLASGKRQELESYQSEHVYTNLRRASLLAAGAMYLSDPRAAESEQVIDTASTLQAAEGTLSNVAETVDAITEDLELPPDVTFTSVTGGGEELPLDETSTYELVIANVGSQPAEGVSITHESDLTIAPDEQRIDFLEPDGEQTVSFEVTASAEGQTTVSFVASSANAGTDRQSVPVLVRSRTGVLEGVEETLLSLLEEVEDNPSISSREANDLTDALESAIDAVRRAIDADEQTEESETIWAATVHLGAFLNTFERVSGPSAAFRWSVTRHAEGAIEQLSAVMRPLSIDDAIDANDNDQIDDSELLRAFKLWQGSDPVPGTAGKRISNGKMAELIERYAQDVPEWAPTVGVAGVMSAALYGYLKRSTDGTEEE